MTTPSNALSRMLDVLPADQRAEVAQRYAEHAPLLLDRLSRLYGTRGDFAEWFAGLMESVALLHAARSLELRRLDTERADIPHWFLGQKMLGYSAYVDRFGGTLRGVAERIPHLCELGVTYLHLLPFLRPRMGDNDGGFAVASYDDVDPRLGTISDLEGLTAKLRKAGISLCSDFVLNHVADDHAWAQGAARGDARLRNYFYLFEDREVPDRFERTLVQIFPQAAPGNFTYSEAMRAWVWTTFYPYQWDLNYSNPEVFGEMVCALLRLANRGIEVFRLDSTAFLWKREGTNGMNQPETHWILQAIRCIIEIAAPGVLLKAEAIVPTRELPAYFGEGQGRECHLAYHSSLMAAGWAALAEQRVDLLRSVIDATPALPAPASWLTYVRCHDDIGWNVLRPDVESAGGAERLAAVSRFYSGTDPESFADGAAFQTGGGLAVHGTNGMASALAGFSRARSETDLQLAGRRLILLYGLALSFGGVPLIYMGDEIALGNDESDTGLAARQADGRWMQRPAWDESRHAERWSATGVPGRVFTAMRRLVQQRQRLQALAADAPRQLLNTGNDAVLALKRGERFVALLNFSGDPAAIDPSLLAGADAQGTWFDCLAEKDVADKFILEPWATMWLERKA